MTAILLLSGPNLDLLGTREPSTYGTATLADHVSAARAVAGGAGVALDDVQSASEPELVAAVHGARGRYEAIVINPGALSHYGWSLHDALAAFDGVVVEIHLSHTSKREPWRHTSVVSPVADATMLGLGPHAYPVGVEVALRLLASRAG